MASFHLTYLSVNDSRGAVIGRQETLWSASYYKTPKRPLMLTLHGRLAYRYFELLTRLVEEYN